MNKNLKYWLVCGIFSILSSVTKAEIDLFQMSMEELLQIEVTTASGFKQNVSQSPANMTIYYPWQWQAMGIERLDQLLAIVPGFHVMQSQISLNMDIYSTRGLKPELNNMINLLMDGQLIKAYNGGSTTFGFKKSLAGIKRIEIIKGPGSVLYGADAFSGVINLITEQSDNGAI